MVNTSNQIRSSSIDNIGFDQLSSTLLALILLSLFINSFFSKNGHSLIHPILLGRQSELARVRKESESPVITNYGSLPGMLPVSPQRSITSLHQLLLESQGNFSQSDIEAPIPPNLSFKNLISATRNHLWSALVGAKPDDHETQPRLLILCSNPYLQLVLSLAAATLPFATVLVSLNKSGSIPVEVQQACKTYLPHLSLVISDGMKEGIDELLEPECQAQTIYANQLSDWFKESERSLAPDTALDLQKARLIMISHPRQVFWIDLQDDKRKHIQVLTFMPDNLLAGVTASLGLFPLSAKLASKDRVALQLDEDSTWGCRTSLAIATLYVGAEVCFFHELKHVVDWQPTVLVLKPTTAQTLSEQIVQCSKRSLFTKFAMGRRLSALADGVLVGPLSEAADWVGPKLRAILTNGPISQSSASLIRAGLGVSFQRVYCHPAAAGPILASQAYDFQMLQPSGAAIHCGPPSVNVECKIVGVPELSIVNSDAVKGKLLVRGPSIAVQISDGGRKSNSGHKTMADDGFVQVEENAEVLTNGTLKVHYPPPWDQ